MCYNQISVIWWNCKSNHTQKIKIVLLDVKYRKVDHGKMNVLGESVYYIEILFNESNK